jgi:VIT1/CCC1 family predicted Fe2+/Mn2+ transporter
VAFYVLISRIFGFTFGVKLMEAGESGAGINYGALVEVVSEAERIADDEHAHEDELLGLLDEERLRYTGSMVLGLSDALVELTGALAGLTLALRNGPLIAMTGLITGIAAALSMAASEYLSTKSEENRKNPLKAAFYTGFAYLTTVGILILPYLLLENYILSLACTLVAAVLIIAAFMYYISVAKGLDFKARFLEMTGLSLAVAAVSFGIGLALRHFFDLDI